MFKPNISAFITPIRIQHRTDTMVNGAPYSSPVDATDPVALCGWKGKGGTQSVNAGRLTVQDTAEVTMWYRSDIVESDILLKNDDANQAYEIVNAEDVEERHVYLILKVKRVKGT